MPRLRRSAAGLGSTPDMPTSGTIQTNTLDLGGVPTSAPTYSIDAITPNGTSVSVTSSRSSVDGVAWSAWTAPSNGTLTSPLRRYWQVEVTLATTSLTVSPTLLSFTLYDYNIPPNWDWNGGGQWNAS